MLRNQVNFLSGDPTAVIKPSGTPNPYTPNTELAKQILEHAAKVNPNKNNNGGTGANLSGSESAARTPQAGNLGDMGDIKGGLSSIGLSVGKSLLAGAPLGAALPAAFTGFLMSRALKAIADTATQEFTGDPNATAFGELMAAVGLGPANYHSSYDGGVNMAQGTDTAAGTGGYGGNTTGAGGIAGTYGGGMGATGGSIGAAGTGGYGGSTTGAGGINGGQK
jgi:hypothetical protein